MNFREKKLNRVYLFRLLVRRAHPHISSHKVLGKVKIYFIGVDYYEFPIFPLFVSKDWTSRTSNPPAAMVLKRFEYKYLGPQYPSIEFALTPHNVWTADSRVFQRVGAGREPVETQVHVDSDCFMGGLLLSHEGVSSPPHCNGLVSPLCVCIVYGHVV